MDDCQTPIQKENSSYLFSFNVWDLRMQSYDFDFLQTKIIKLYSERLFISHAVNRKQLTILHQR